MIRKVQIALKQILRKKLEEVVLDTMSHPSQVPEEFLEYEEIARENGFMELVENGFGEIKKEVGDIQIRRGIQREQSRIIREEEKALQAYFVAENGKRLEDIEQGLIYQTHEEQTRAGRPDITARDKEGRKVKIELKAREYDSRRVALQLKKYLEDNQEGNERVIFIAPEVNGGLLLALGQEEREGKLDCFQVEKTNGSYSLTRVKPEDIPEPKPINWGRRTRKKQGGLVRVTAELPRERGIREAEEEEWMNEELPLYYRLSILLRVDPEDRDRLLEPVEVTRERMDGLETLLCPPYLSRARQALEKNLPFYVEEKELDLLVKKVNFQFSSPKLAKDFSLGDLLTRKYCGVAEKLEVIIHRLIGAAKTNMTLKGHEEIKRQLTQRTNELETLINEGRYIEPFLRRFRNILRGLLRGSERGEANTSEEAQRILRSMLAASSFYGPDLTCQFAKVKLDGANALMEGNYTLGATYFAFDPVLLWFIEGGHREVKEKSPSNPIRLDRHFMHKYVMADTELYAEILSKFRVKEEPTPQPRTEPRQIIVSEEPTPIPRSTLEYTIESVASVSAFNSRHVSEDSRLKAGYFLDEVLNNEQYPRELRRKLAHEAKDSRWYTQNLSDMEVRNLFDDLTVWAATGKKPSTFRKF